MPHTFERPRPQPPLLSHATRPARRNRHSWRCRAQKDQGYGRRQREASPSSQRPAVSSPRQSYRYADLAACRPWQELTKRDQVSIAPFGEPAPPCDKFGAEVARAQWGRQKMSIQAAENKKDRPWSAVIGRVIRHTFAFMICNELIINKRNSITKFDINLEKYLYGTTQF
ncbi:hypothetical protein BANRA_05404 [Klebsiella pneumoniae]|nr:hypothetical protein BANRA_05404 [Klebsiella pneumoniae]